MIKTLQKLKTKAKNCGLQGAIIMAMSGGLIGCVTLAPTSTNTANTTSSNGSYQSTKPRPRPMLQHMPAPSNWRLHYISNTNVAEAMQYRTFNLHYENTRLSGRAGNSYSTTATFHNNGTVNINPRLMTTRMMVQGLKGKMEKRYFQLLSHAQRWTIQNNSLIIRSPYGELHFKPSY